jgi:tetratricopeptide (TPR) repeat protein
LLAAQRHEELLQLLETAPFRWWNDRQYGVSALCAMGRPAEAIRYAEESRGLNDDPVAIAHACEEILLSSGRTDEAYARYGLLANQAGTNLAWFRAVAKKYPNKRPVDILTALANLTPGDEGQWFAAAKDAGLYDEALALARQSPCDPRTLMRAARDFAEKNPAFAVQAGLTSLHWLTRGYGYEITSADVWGAYAETLRAAEGISAVEETRERIRKLIVNDSSVGQIVTTVLARILGLR